MFICRSEAAVTCFLMDKAHYFVPSLIQYDYLHGKGKGKGKVLEVNLC